MGLIEWHVLTESCILISTCIHDFMLGDVNQPCPKKCDMAFIKPIHRNRSNIASLLTNAQTSSWRQGMDE